LRIADFKKMPSLREAIWYWILVIEM
jgi:hypothetical protein